MPDQAAKPLRYGWILWLAGLSGAISFSYEIIFTRMLGHLLGGSVYAFATMLSGKRIESVPTRSNVVLPNGIARPSVTHPPQNFSPSSKGIVRSSAFKGVISVADNTTLIMT